MTTKYGVAVDDVFNTMEERFRPEGVQGVEGAFGYDIKGAGKWKLTVAGGRMKIERSEALDDCLCVISTDPETFTGINLGKVDGMKAFSSGLFKVKGDMGAFAKTARMFKKFVIPKKGMTTRDYILDMFGTLEKRFQPQNAVGMEAVIAYDITGKDGGQWSAYIKDGSCTVQEGIADKPSVTLSVTGNDWVNLMLGKVDPMSLLGSGRAAISGDIQLAMKLGEIFAPYAAADETKEQELLVLKKTISVQQRFATGPVMGRFLNALKEKKILANKCPRCGRLQLPPREICAECRERAEEWVEVGPKGHLTLIDVVYYASPDPLTGETRETPYGTIWVLLDGCKGNETFMHVLRPDQLDRVEEAWNEKEGTRLRPVWSENRTGECSDIRYFEIDD
jgi:uncharacterized OB-fold protein/putative sterol carrier protein